MRTNRTLPKPKFSPLAALLPYQLKWVKDRSRFKIGVWSRQTELEQLTVRAFEAFEKLPYLQ